MEKTLIKKWTFDSLPCPGPKTAPSEGMPDSVKTHMVPDVQMVMNNVCPFAHFYFKKVSYIEKKKHCFSYMEMKVFPI